MIILNIYQNHRNLAILRQNEAEFHWKSIGKYAELARVVRKMPDGYGVILLNRHAVRMTLNWLCNTQKFNGVHQRILFIVMDKYSEEELRKYYFKLHIVIWLAPILQKSFKPYDTIYMSFFLMRTNMIKALQTMKKGFWMLQADTVWRDNFFEHFDVGTMPNADIILDQQGYEETSLIRQKTMNGANFYIPIKPTSVQLVDSWLSWQKSVYITDPDLIKLFCLRGDYNCQYIPYKYVTGWEWIYGTQKNAPIMIQMDGETGGNKEEIMRKYGFWFLDKFNRCKIEKVEKAIQTMTAGKIPKINSQSKNRERFYLKLGEFLNQIPIFGHYSSIYGGLTSLYLQFF